MNPIIFHVDIDAFYASVEEFDRPYLKGKPLIIGGNSSRGVVTTANYEARKYGVHSAMPVFLAKKRCPHGILLPPRMKRYQEISDEVFSILRQLTPIVEKVSIDEAYLSLEGLREGPGQNIIIKDFVKKMRVRIYEKTGMTLSIGISYNKFLAKIASEWNKPQGIKVISPHMVPRILEPLPIEKVHGLGPKSCSKLSSMGIITIKDLFQLSEKDLEKLLGKVGKEIYGRIRGIDSRPLTTFRRRKSLGIERTLKENTKDFDTLLSHLESFSFELSRDLKKRNLYFRTLTLKIKCQDFNIYSRSRTSMNTLQEAEEIYPLSLLLFKELNLKTPLRLIGISASNFSKNKEEQLSFLQNSR